MILKMCSTIFVVALATVLLLSVYTYTAQAACLHPTPSKDQLNKGDVVFVGTVASVVKTGQKIQYDRHYDEVQVIFNIEHYWSNAPVQKQLTLTQVVPSNAPQDGSSMPVVEDGPGEARFVTGKTYAVVARKDANGYVATIAPCGETHILSGENSYYTAPGFIQDMKSKGLGDGTYLADIPQELTLWQRIVRFFTSFRL